MLETFLPTTVIDCAPRSTREINQLIKALAQEGHQSVELINPAGRHSLIVGVEAALQIRVKGSVGYFCGGLCESIALEIDGSCGWSLGENLMSGTVTVLGNASANVGASARGGNIAILGNAGARAGISLKGATVIVKGNVGHSSAFMMQQGRLVVCGNAGENLGDSMYQGEIFVGGAIASLGADARLEPLTDADWHTLRQDLNPLGIDPQTLDFKKVVCAQQLYHFKARDFHTFKDAY